MTERKEPWTPVVSDETLIAWQAGTLPAEQAAAVAARLLVDPELADRSIHLDPLGAALRMGLTPLLDEAPTDQLIAALQTEKAPSARQPEWRPLLMRGGLLAAGFAAGVVLTPFLSDQPARSPGWVEAASNMVRLVSPEMILPDQGGQQAYATRLALVGDAAGTDLSSFNDGFEGFRPLRVDLLAFEGKPLIQLSYASERGEIVVLCLLVRDAAVSQDSPRIAETFEGLAGLRWDSANLGVLVVGAQMADVEAMARQL